MFSWGEVVGLAVLFLAVIIGGYFVMLSAIRRHMDIVMQAIRDLPFPVVEPGTVVKHYPVETTFSDRVTPSMIVAEWASEQEARGNRPTDDELAEQRELWAQNEELM